MRGLFSSVPGRVAAVILGIGALITSIGAITGFWASQVLQNTEDTIVAEIVLDASRTMSEPLNPRPGDTESRWSSAKRFVLNYTATRYEAANSYIALRHFGGPCSSSLTASGTRPPVDWPATRYFFGPWRIYGGSELDFGRSGGVAERFRQALDERARDFYHVGFASGQAKSRLCPELAADQGQGIREGRLRFVVPGRLPSTDRRSAHVLMGDQGDPREQSEQRRGRAADR